MADWLAYNSIWAAEKFAGFHYLGKDTQEPKVSFAQVCRHGCRLVSACVEANEDHCLL
jgi:hypothetical protein